MHNDESGMVNWDVGSEMFENDPIISYIFNVFTAGGVSSDKSFVRTVIVLVLVFLTTLPKGLLSESSSP